MIHTYHISGMTCNGCVAKAKSALLKIGDVTEAQVQLSAPQAILTMQKHIPLSTLQSSLSAAGNYTITEADNGAPSDPSTSWFSTYKPILLIGGYITGTTLLAEAVKETFNISHWMHHFMAAFFLVFSFFKLLNLKGFADSYATYDIIAKKWNGWGYVYAFIELALGLSYLLHFHLLITNWITLVVMTISIVGVLQSVLSNKQIQCACLGTVFNLPMSTITVVEDGLMIAMSLLTIFPLLN